MDFQWDEISARAWDVVVIGGGPGGSCAATTLAREGWSVLVLERDRFPRFHIGESLLPYNQQIFQKLGVQDKIEQAGFIRKYGAQFHLADGSRQVAVRFRDGQFNLETQAFQVERSRFDELLLRHAQDSGARVVEGARVLRTKVESDAETVAVHIEDDAGGMAEVRGRYLIDASGRDNHTGNQEGLRQVHPRLKKMSVFAHFAGVRLDEGTRGGDTVIVRLADKWFWLIPIAPDKVSVGLVLDRDALRAGAVESVFWDWVRSSEAMQRRMETAQATTPFWVTSDFSYRNSRLTSFRQIRVGDAAGFIDPIFSSGVYLAMHSAHLAANTLIRIDRGEVNEASAWRDYERKVVQALDLYREMVEAFYTTPFMEVFLEPRAKWRIAAAVNAVLAGELDGGWRLRWRLRLFFLLVRLQRTIPFMPRIDFGSAPLSSEKNWGPSATHSTSINE